MTAGPGAGRGYVVGVGVASAATPAELAELVAGVLREAGVHPDDVQAVATVASRRDHPAVVALGRPVVAFTAADLDAGRAVAEPAALRAAGPGSVLVVSKRRSARATAAVAAPAPAARPA